MDDHRRVGDCEIVENNAMGRQACISAFNGMDSPGPLPVWRAFDNKGRVIEGDTGETDLAVKQTGQCKPNIHTVSGKPGRGSGAVADGNLIQPHMRKRDDAERNRT